MAYLIFVHGMSATKFSWFDIPQKMQDSGHTCSVESLPGHIPLDPEGLLLKKAQHGSDITLDDYAQSVVDQIPLSGRVTLIGHSMGGCVISKVAEMMPNRVAGLIYLCALLPTSGSSIVSLASEAGTTPSAAMEEFASVGIGLGHPALGAQPLGPLGQEIALGASFDGVPRHYIACEQDQILPLAFQYEMAGRWPGTHTYEITGSGHIPQITHEAELLARLSSIIGPAH